MSVNAKVVNANRKIISSMGQFRVLEYQKDLSVSRSNAQTEYFMGQMGVRRRQVMIELDDSSVILQGGAMQWSAGDIEATTGIKGVGDMLGKMVRGAVTKESAIKPEYRGTGILMLEPTYKYIILLDVEEWAGGITIEDGMFLACDSTVQHKIAARSRMSAAMLGGEGLFNLSLAGKGTVCLESCVPADELIEVELVNDVLKIDGNLALAWSTGLSFTVEKSGKSLIGSAVSGEGLVNVYRGTGRVLMSPVAPTYSLAAATGTTGANPAPAKK